MSNLYRVNSGDLPLASDLDQFVDAFNGTNDVGQITFAPQTPAPTFTATAATAAGTALGIGAYIYRFTWVVGYRKSNGNYVFGGETNAGPSVSVTTTSGNQAVTLSGLPTSFPSNLVVGLRIYRTTVNGADMSQKLVTTLTTLSATYTDTTTDANLGTAIPTVNTTGTSLKESNYLGGREMIPNYNQYASVVGNNNIYTVVQLKRQDGTLYMQSTLSNPDGNGNYQTDTWQFYDSSGTTVIKTHVWSLTWDSNGKITQKVMTS